MDRFDATKRSAIMRSVRSKDTKPEMALRSALHARGLRFRLHAKLLAGRPDIVLPRWRACIVSAALGPYPLHPVLGSMAIHVYRRKDRQELEETRRSRAREH